MSDNSKFYFSHRKFNSIELWKDVSIEDWNDPLWQRKNSIKSVEQLSKIIKLSDYQKKEIKRTIDVLASQGKAPLRITPFYASLIHENPFELKDKNNQKQNKKIDPIFWQSVPTPANLMFSDSGPEASMDEPNRSFGSAYQRYPNRVALLVATNTSCASYCNHCQRAKSLDSTINVSLDDIKKGIFYIKLNKNINEVLVTGGDPLMMKLDILQFILEELSKIEHIRVIRIASRVPVVLPMAINKDLLHMIKESSNKHTNGIRKYVYFMTHINHYNEITEELADAAKLINDFGFTIRNQTVLLNHINDNFQILAETFRRMFWIGIHPYYLLQCHKEKGILHFITPIQIGKIYMKHLQGWISGITIPRYAVNIEGGGGKVLLMPSGHDTMNAGVDLDKEISPSAANVKTWDSRLIHKYEALGRTTLDEYESSVELMDKFFDRKGVFLPRLIIIDNDGNYIGTSNRSKLPLFNNSKKARILGYSIFNDMPITNPNELKNLLLDEYEKSKF